MLRGDLTKRVHALMRDLLRRPGVHPGPDSGPRGERRSEYSNSPTPARRARTPRFKLADSAMAAPLRRPTFHWNWIDHRVHVTAHTDNQFRVRASRNPNTLARKSAERMSRSAERRFRGGLIQVPPRTTRLEHSPEYRGLPSVGAFS